MRQAQAARLLQLQGASSKLPAPYRQACSRQSPSQERGVSQWRGLRACPSPVSRIALQRWFCTPMTHCLPGTALLQSRCRRLSHLPQSSTSPGSHLLHSSRPGRAPSLHPPPEAPADHHLSARLCSRLLPGRTMRTIRPPRQSRRSSSKGPLVRRWMWQQVPPWVGLAAACSCPGGHLELGMLQ